MFVNQKICAGLLGLALTAAMGQAAEPTIDYSLELKLTYTGVLYQSTDGVNWTKVEGATSPYYVPVKDAKKMLFCSKDEEDQPGDLLIPGENAAIPLSGTVNLDMNWIAPGTFIMGSPEDELGRRDNETQHQVTLTKGYWLGKYEVTQAQYKAVTGGNPSEFVGDNDPVENVSWFDAVAFCEKLTKIEKAAGRLPEGYEYTLPTEAQWEYACRAGTATAFSNGTNVPTKEQIEDARCFNLDTIAWYKFNSLEKPHPVGQKQPNAWGLYDMHGNVAEWCSDWYKKDYPNPFAVDPVGPYTAIRRVVRGGSGDDSAGFCRSASRDCNTMPFSDSTVGFRVALVYNPNIMIPLSEDVGLEMVRIEPGTFLMGSPEDELGRFDGEIQHQVTLTQEYWLGRYEVTQAQYEAVMGANPSRFKGADLPVEKVSWYDAMEFCAKLTAIEREADRLPEGYEYTLPTEAQWEYACRAGTTTVFNNGTNIETEEQIEGECPNLDPVGWYMYNSGSKTHPVGQKQPNAWGLYDMHGNVWEWCLDWYGDYPTSAVTDPTGTSTGSYRVVRGGSWDCYVYYCRSAYRYNIYPVYNYSNNGFRVALAPVQ